MCRSSQHILHQIEWTGKLNYHIGVTMHNTANVKHIKVIHRGVHGWKRRYHFGRLALLCICNAPWIEGTTAKAIYGRKIKDFNVHSCCNCGGWFHKYCLRACGIQVPKRTCRGFSLSIVQNTKHYSMEPPSVYKYLHFR